MADSWLIYAPVTSTAAASALAAMYETLGGIVGEDLAEHLEPGEELEPPVLGLWPNLSVATSPVPTAAEVRARLGDAPKKAAAKLDEAALERLASCKVTIRIAAP